jgi:hypothetical protein
VPITIEARENASILEPGVYDAKIIDMAEETGQYGAQVKFIFEVADVYKDNGENVQQWAWASATLSPKSKLWKWLKNVTGIVPVLGQPFDVTAALIGQPCQIVVGFNDETQRVFIENVLGVKKQGKQAPGQQAKAEEKENLCEVEGCSAEVEKYTKKGRGLCSSHDAEDL